MRRPISFRADPVTCCIRLQDSTCLYMYVQMIRESQSQRESSLFSSLAFTYSFEFCEVVQPLPFAWETAFANFTSSETEPHTPSLYQSRQINITESLSSQRLPGILGVFPSKRIPRPALQVYIHSARVECSPSSPRGADGGEIAHRAAHSEAPITTKSAPRRCRRWTLAPRCLAQDKALPERATLQRRRWQR